MLNNVTDNLILKQISLEIEKKYNCEVISIRYAELLSLCARVKIKFKDDFLYQPFSTLPKPDTIIFSERSISFTQRIDLFDCVIGKAKLN